MFAIIISEKGGSERRESFDKNEINVGRVQGNDLMLPKGNVSKHHARLLFRDGRFIVTDLKSTNGTYVNGRKIAQATIVREGDKIYIGDFVLRLETNGAGSAPSVDAQVAQRPIEDAPPPPPPPAPVAPPPAAPAPQPPVARPPPAVTMKAPTHPPGAPLPRPLATSVSNASAVPGTSRAAETFGAEAEPPHESAPTGQKPRTPTNPPPPPAAPMGGPVRPMTVPLNQMSPSPLMPQRPPSLQSTLAGAHAAPLAPATPGPVSPMGASIGNPIAGLPGPMGSPSPLGGPSPMGAPLGGPIGGPNLGAVTPPATPVGAALGLGAPPPAAPAPVPSPSPGLGTGASAPGLGFGGAPSGPAANAASAAGGVALGRADRPGAAPAFPAVDRAPAPAPVIPLPSAAEPAPATGGRPVRGTAPPPRMPPKETPAQAGRRLALMTLLDRIADAIDLGPLRTSPLVPDPLAQQIDRVAREQANAMRDEGDAPEGIDLDAVAREAHRELVGLGAFAPLLDDEEVGEIHCARFDQLFTVRGGPNAVAEGAAFSSEEALARVIGRLALQSGESWKPGETIFERRLPRATVVAIVPPAAANLVVSIRKRRRVETTFDELTRAGSLSKNMAQFLEACVAARTNMFVSGNAPLPLLSALASAVPAGERLVVVQDVEEIGVGNAQVASLSPSAGSVRAGAKLQGDRLSVIQLTAGVSTATIDVLTEGTDGVFAALSAPTLRQGMSRVVAQLVLHRPGLAAEAVREVIGDAFDIAVEINALPDGRLRVTRIAELGGVDAKGVVLRDLFLFSPDPGPDGSFNATGVVPRVANDLAARGTKLDPALFKRK